MKPRVKTMPAVAAKDKNVFLKINIKATKAASRSENGMDNHTLSARTTWRRDTTKELENYLARQTHKMALGALLIDWKN